MHPREKRIVICDLCNGNPQCVKVCQEGSWNVLRTVKRGDEPYRLYARKPDEITRDLASKIYGELGEEHL
jgi:Fe-S-cluster-containing hydrogenase component 2